MNRIIFTYFIAFILLGFASCDSKKNAWTEKNVIVDVQPFAGFSNTMTQELVLKLKSIFPNINIKQEIQLPSSSFYRPRNRYRADSLLLFLSKSIPEGHVTIALTNKDISTTNGKINDWGIMGLGNRPGNACVVSSFRLNKKTLSDQFYKVCIHELGHTAGLDHCPEKTCFMRDAEGGNPIEEEKEFCDKCRKFLTGKGWNLIDIASK